MYKYTVHTVYMLNRYFNRNTWSVMQLPYQLIVFQCMKSVRSSQDLRLMY